MILSEAIIRAIFVAWDASGINSSFTDLWKTSDVSDGYPPLTVYQAAPNHPFPYSVLSVGATRTRSKMSSVGNKQRAIRATDISFSVFTQAMKIQGGRTPKRLAADLAGEIMGVFGGSNENAPSTLTFQTGNHLGTYYQRDFHSVDDGMEVWTIDYMILSDIAVAL